MPNHPTAPEPASAAGQGAVPPRADEIHDEEGWGGNRADVVKWAIRQAVLLAAFWLLLSGHYTPLLLTLGACSVAFVCWLTHRAGLSEHRESALRFALRMPLYALWLGKEVLASAAKVVRLAWSPRIDLDPQVGTTRATDMSVLAEVTYANSITITPGTLSMQLRDDDITVHSLDRADIDDLNGGRMLHRVRRLETPAARLREIEAREREQDQPGTEEGEA